LQDEHNSALDEIDRLKGIIERLRPGTTSTLRPLSPRYHNEGKSSINSIQSNNNTKFRVDDMASKEHPRTLSPPLSMRNEKQ